MSSIKHKKEKKVWFADKRAKVPALVILADIDVDKSDSENLFLVYTLHDLNGNLYEKDVNETWLFDTKDEAWDALIDAEKYQAELVKTQLKEIENRIAKMQERKKGF